LNLEPPPSTNTTFNWIWIKWLYNLYEWVKDNILKDYVLEVGRGNINGVTFMFAKGEFESGNATASGEDVCRSEDVSGPSTLLWPADAGEQMSIVSTSAADNGTSVTGALTVTIEYLDADGNEQTETKTIDGQTVVHTTATNIRFVNDFYVKTVGSGGVAAGNISIYKFGGSIGTNLYNIIALGGNKSLVPHRMVPLGKKLYLMVWRCSEAQGKRTAFRIRSTDMNGVLHPGVFLFKDTAYIKQDSTGDLSLHAIKIPALSMIKVSYWSAQAGAEGSCSWWGYLVND